MAGRGGQFDRSVCICRRAESVDTIAVPTMEDSLLDVVVGLGGR
jgi:hypothetical protein